MEFQKLKTTKKKKELIETIEKQKIEIGKLRQWVDDLQSGMYINCVYCGHRYGPGDNTDCSMAEILKQHIENCADHPMSILKKEIEELR